MMTRKRKRNKRKRSGISRWLAAVLSILSLTPLAAGQSTGGDAKRTGTTRTIEGRVLTKAGAGVAGAVVLLKDNKTLQVRSYIAQQNGLYHFFGLSTEVNYTLRAENHGMTSKQKQVSVFDSHSEVKLDLKLSQEIKQPKSQQPKEK